MIQRMVVLAMLMCAALVGSVAQQHSLDSLLRAHSYGLSISRGSLEGEGLDLILEAARDAQFFVIAEEHNVSALNALSGHLFEELHGRFGFNYIALEQGTVVTSMLGDERRRGDMTAIRELIHTYPHAPTFATDEELQLVADVGGRSSAETNPIWGVDQEFGVLHILERLAELAPDKAARDKVKELADSARAYELDRSGDVHFAAQVLVPDDLSELPTLFHPKAGSEAQILIEALQRTNRIYHNYWESRRGKPTAHENGREREESMKLRFMELYRQAQEKGEALPRVVAKLGHWHTLRGFSQANVPTFGNFLSEFSISNGMKTFILSTYVIEGPESWRNNTGVLQRIASPSQFTVVDFRPLRPHAHQGKISDLSDAWKRLLFRADAALIIRGGETGSYGISRGK